VQGSLDKIFKPNSIAVIGASGKKGSHGYSVLNYLIDYDFSSRVCSVNLKAKATCSIKCYSTITGGRNNGNLFVTTTDCVASKWARHEPGALCN